MDLGAEAMGTYKAREGGCTYIQVRIIAVPAFTNDLTFVLVQERTQRLQVCPLIILHDYL